MELILSVFKSYSDGKRMKDIKSSVVALMTPPDQLICENQAQIEEDVEFLIKEDKKLENESYLSYSNGIYKKRKNKRVPGTTSAIPPINSDYIGRAGECAVMSELMFRGYNANRMMIDEGVDIVAVKDNLYYYVQVKTSFIKNGRIYCQIGVDRFDQYISAQIRYVIVARYREKDSDKNMFFVFTPREIDKYVHDRCIKRGDNSVSIKIAFHEKTGEPYLYDEKTADVSWNMNRFNL